MREWVADRVPPPPPRRPGRSDGAGAATTARPRCSTRAWPGPDRLRVPARADLVYDFLPVAWRTIQHYGVEVAQPALQRRRPRPLSQPHQSLHRRQAGKWPIRFDPDDVSRVYFQDPADDAWHTLPWEHAAGRPRALQRRGPGLRPPAGGRDGTVSRTTAGCWPSCWSAGTPGWPATRPSVAWHCACRSSATAVNAKHSGGQPEAPTSSRLPTVQARDRGRRAEPCEPDPGPAAGDDDGDERPRRPGAGRSHR